LDATNLSNILVSKVLNVFLKEALNDTEDLNSLSNNEYRKGSFKKLSLVLAENFGKVLSSHYNSFKGLFKNDSVELSARFQAFVIASFRFFLIRLLLWIYGSLTLDEESLADDIKVNFNDEVLIDKELGSISNLIFLFLELLDLELEFLNVIVSNIRAFALNSSKNITYFLYSSYAVYGKVPLLPEFHLVVMRTIFPYVLRNYLTPLSN